MIFDFGAIVSYLIDHATWAMMIPVQVGVYVTFILLRVGIEFFSFLLQGFSLSDPNSMIWGLLRDFGSSVFSLLSFLGFPYDDSEFSQFLQKFADFYDVLVAFMGFADQLLPVTYFMSVVFFLLLWKAICVVIASILRLFSLFPIFGNG
jgi:hypothetical protein